MLLDVLALGLFRSQFLFEVEQAERTNARCVAKQRTP